MRTDFRDMKFIPDFLKSKLLIIGHSRRPGIAPPCPRILILHGRFCKGYELAADPLSSFGLPCSHPAESVLGLL